ncbi:MAG: site-specific integrase [Oleispira sp.]|nr:site-specific integrase [Oleispira sp.]MBL4881541.1 site-specific integrase [Oleispira sp.]
MAHFEVQIIKLVQGVKTRKSCAVYNTETHVIEVAVTAYLTYMIKTGLKWKTVYNAASTIKTLLNAVEADPKIDSWYDLTDENMSAYISGILYGQMMIKPSTLDVYITRLKSFFDWVYENGWVEESMGFSYKITSEELRELMAFNSGKKNSLDPYSLGGRYIPSEDFETLLSYKGAQGTFERERDDIILKLGYYSGFRAGEVVDPLNMSIVKIKTSIARSKKKAGVSGIPMEGFEMTIIGKGQGAGKPRTISIPQDLQNQIERFISITHKISGGDLLICSREGKVLRDGHATDVFTDAKKNIAKHADIEIVKIWQANDENWTYHALRHCFATNLCELCRLYNVSYEHVRERMGHEDFETTKIYIAFNAKLQGVMDEFYEYLPNRKRKEAVNVGG